MEPPRLLDDGRAVEVGLNGAARRFHAIWLRDNAPDPATRRQGNGQKLITLLDIPPDTRIADAQWACESLRVRFEPEGKVVDFDPAWLLAHAYDKPAGSAVGWVADEIERWDAALSIPVERHDAVRADPAARLRWLKGVRRHGIARLTGVPTTSGGVVNTHSVSH